MKSALSSTMMATDLADYLVGKGSTFRDAHEAVGNLIREAERKGCELSALPGESFSSAHPLFADDAMDWLDPAQSVARRSVPGGTAPEAVRAQIAAAEAAIRPVRDTPRGNELSLQVV
jgi:argininosuccinate lyase